VATFDVDGDVEEAEASSAKPYFGVNAGYDFSERFGLSLNYDRLQADGDGLEVDVDLLTLGAELRFSAGRNPAAPKRAARWVALFLGATGARWALQNSASPGIFAACLIQSFICFPSNPSSSVMCTYRTCSCLDFSGGSGLRALPRWKVTLMYFVKQW